MVDEIINVIENERKNERRDKNIDLADYNARTIYRELEKII